MNVKQCPECKENNAKYSVLGPQGSEPYYEIRLASYCPDCGYSWTIIYHPIETIDRG